MTLAYFPECWKVARVSGIPKPGNPRQEVTGYRPISLLPMMGKIFGRWLLSSWRRTRSCCSINSALELVTRPLSNFSELFNQFIAHELNIQHLAATVQLDLTQAFDSAWHDAFLFKLNKIGLPPSFLKSIRSYLSERFLCISIKGADSARYLVTAGVPPASIVGPILFNIFINDIPDKNNCTLALYVGHSRLLFLAGENSYL